MKTSMPESDPIKAHQRKKAASRRLGVNAQCSSCPEKRPEALDARTNPVICGQCRRKKKGKSMMDAHHIAGQANSPITTSIPTNDHRAELTVAQRDWQPKVLDNPDGCPLLRAAAHIRGFIDTVVYYMKEFLLWTTDLLVALSALLKQEWGARWWLKKGFKRFAMEEDSNNG